MNEIMNGPNFVDNAPEYKEKITRKVIYERFLVRCVAWLIDISIVLCIDVLFIAMWQIVTGIYIFADIFIIMISMWIVGFLYACTMDYLTKGQTIGQLVVKVKTVRENTFGNPSMKDLAINNALKFSPLLVIDITIGLIKNWGDPEKKVRITQTLSNTVVIKV